MAERNLLPVEDDERRLTDLLQSRLDPKADRKAVDRRLWDLRQEARQDERNRHQKDP